MTDIKLLGRLLRMRDFLRIKHYFFADRDKELHVRVKPYRNGCQCPVCGRRCRVIRDMPDERTWRDLRVCGQDVILHYQPREINCPTHGRAQERIPWAEPYAQVTYRFEYLMLRLCRNMPQSEACTQLNCPPSTLSGILHRTIRRCRQEHNIRGLRTVGVDEISYERGHRFATVVYDLDRGCVVWVGEGKGRFTIDAFFRDCLSPAQRAAVRFASCDMSQTYIDALKAWCPNATLVLDRFHIVKALNAAVDEVRKQEWRELRGSAEGKAIKGLRWLLYRHSDTRTAEQTRLLNDLRRSNRRIWRAWVLKDEFERFWDYSYPGAARGFITRWTRTALRSRLAPMRAFVKTLRNHLEDILSFIDTRLTNAAAEGINRIIRMVKNRASGFGNLDSFIDLIYLRVGDVDIPEQIPLGFRTL